MASKPTAPRTRELYQEYLRALVALFESAFVDETNDEALVAAANRTASAANLIRSTLGEAARIDIAPEGIYVERALLELDASLWEPSDYFSTVCSALGVASIGARDDTSAADWLALIAELRRCVGPGGTYSTFADARVPTIALERSVGPATNPVTRANRFRALRAYATTVIGIAEVLDAARENRVLRPVRVKRPLQEMISVADDAVALLLALAYLKRHKLAPQHHLANAAVFAIVALRPLGLPRANLCGLALSAAFHDLGRALAPSNDDASPASERRYALQSVRKLVGSPRSDTRMRSRAVIANEVRRWVDRSAEPPGDSEYPFAIGVASRIVAVAHAFSLLTTPRADRPGLLPDEALRVIIRDAGRRYDAAAVKLFVTTLGVFPVGSTIALSDGRLAIVVEAGQDQAGPGKPRVKIVRDRSGAIVDGEIVDLATSRAVEPVHCVDAEDQNVNPPAFLSS